MKGYPKSRFEIVNQTQIQEITTESVARPTAVHIHLIKALKIGNFFMD